MSQTDLMQATARLENDKRLPALFDLIRDYGDVPCGVWLKGEEKLSMSYAEMARRADDYAAYLKENTTAEDDVLVIGNSSWYYLLADRKTQNQFFYQLPPLEISDQLRDEFYEELRQKPSDCIVLPGWQEDRDRMDNLLGGIRGVLEEDGYRQEEYDEFEAYFRSSIK